jgi:salicylate hydroxylase
MILKSIPKDSLHNGKRLLRIEKRGERRAAIFEDGTEVIADLIVGADGIKSVVRKVLGGISSDASLIQEPKRQYFPAKLPTAD